MREMFVFIRSLVEERYHVLPDNYVDLPWQGLSSFLFLRFFVPPILHPHLFEFLPGKYGEHASNLCTKSHIGLPEEQVQRTLTQVGKVLISLAHLNVVR